MKLTQDYKYLSKKPFNLIFTFLLCLKRKNFDITNKNKILILKKIKFSAKEYFEYILPLLYKERINEEIYYNEIKKIWIGNIYENGHLSLGTFFNNKLKYTLKNYLTIPGDTFEINKMGYSNKNCFYCKNPIKLFAEIEDDVYVNIKNKIINFEYYLHPECSKNKLCLTCFDFHGDYDCALTSLFMAVKRKGYHFSKDMRKYVSNMINNKRIIYKHNPNNEKYSYVYNIVKSSSFIRFRMHLGWDVIHDSDDDYNENNRIIGHIESHNIIKRANEYHYNKIIKKVYKRFKFNNIKNKNGQPNYKYNKFDKFKSKKYYNQIYYKKNKKNRTNYQKRNYQKRNYQKRN